MISISTFFKGPLLLMALFSFLSCQSKNEIEIIHIEGKTMGTTYNVKYVPNNSFPIDQKIVAEKIEEILIQVNNVASTYIPESEISKINKAKKNTSFDLSNEFAFLIKEAIEMNKISRGVFDASLAPLINLWGFGAKGRREIPPSHQEIKQAKENVGMDKFSFDGKKLSKIQDGAELDFSSFAKGHGVDRIVMYLESVQMDDYFVEIGGEVRTRSQAKVWRIGVEKPLDNDERAVSKVLILNGSLATSGNYRNYYKHGGKKFAHGINFYTGHPVENEIASVSVFHRTSTMKADSWATTLMVSENLAEAKKLIKENNLTVMIIYHENEELKVFENENWKREFNL